jgi:beta-N-acetylhexosaminidase
VAEVLNDQNKGFLGSRTYGRDGDFVATAASAFVRGMDRAGVACVVKHFPGNGTEDPHHGLVVLKQERGELEKSMVPFVAVLKRSNPGALMVSHTIVPAVDPKNPSSLSRTVMTLWLKKDLAFPGILLADDFRMGAIAALPLSPTAAVVRSIAAGADMVMTWPQDLDKVHGALVQALARGELDRERLRDAARRIVYQKIRYRIVPPGTGQEDRAVPSVEELSAFKKITETYLKEQLGNF